jgi:hypothetical protein
VTLKVCAEVNCPTLGHNTRCTKHAQAKDQARGTSAQRGYGAAHQRLRADYQRRMDDGERFTCWRCGCAIDPTDWTLGHCDDDRAMYHGPECPPCDYAVAGRAGCPHQSHISPAA